MNPYVLAWIAASALGIALSAYLLFESIRDLVVLHGGNGSRVHIVGRIASESIRVLIYVLFLLIGVPSIHAPVEPGVNVVALVLIVCNVLLMVNSVIAWVVRRLSERHDSSKAALAAEALEVAAALRDTAALAAQRLVDLAASKEQVDRVAEASERTADATERTAANTERP